MELNRFIKKLLKIDSKSRAIKAREARIREISGLGLELADRKGWIDGKFTGKRYELEKDGEVVAGPFDSSYDALVAARKIASGESVVIAQESVK